MAGQRWVCPHCEHATYVPHTLQLRGSTYCKIDSSDGPFLLASKFTVCPNPACAKTTIEISYGTGTAINGAFLQYHFVGPTNSRRLRPATYARSMPDYVPAQVREDYEEACAILDLSPKASATLARRALQGVIRDFHGVSRATLFLEIEAVKDKVDPLTWRAIDAVRSVGNIGAHMEKDINVIVEVEPDEALRLVRLIELLVNDWYVARHRREESLEAMVALGVAKKEQKEAAKRSVESDAPQTEGP